MDRFSCRDPDATARAGKKLGECLTQEGGDRGFVLGLIGELGAGKTLFVQGIAAGLGVPNEVRVTSPTFTLINEYHGGKRSLFHADLYRIEHAAELRELGLDDLCRGIVVVAIEWCDRFPVLPRDHLLVTIEITGADERALTASASGMTSRFVADCWERALAFSD